MFSLCSNSIELRFLSVLRGNFPTKTSSKLNTSKTKVKSNNKNEFALLIKLLLVSLDLKSNNDHESRQR